MTAAPTIHAPTPAAKNAMTVIIKASRTAPN